MIMDLALLPQLKI
uniref:Uncharacterized protein n=1 Tax=Lepeophtheirus salmonis TaxID=72036 RepID=A0A0K2TEL3_LEPSM